MDFDLLKQVNGLWRKIYPFLVSQIMEVYQKDFGMVLELGPFSGGISIELAGKYPGLKITIADESPQVLSYLEEEIESEGLSGSIGTKNTALKSLEFRDSQFDLVIFRGAFFFLDEQGEIFREIFRVLKKGGMAFVGGGYGKNTPDVLIHEIADESREMNDRLGRTRVSVSELEAILRSVQLNDSCHFVEEGGLWVVMEKPGDSMRHKLAPEGKTGTLREAFDVRSGDVISLVGAGGKTTLMFALARELTAHKGLVITTTTTKIFHPSSSETPYVLISEEEDEIVDFILNKCDKYGHITIASEKLISSQKLKGIEAELVSKLCGLGPVTYIIVEADGAAGRPLKAPNTDFEPVIPGISSLVIPVVGIDALGCELNEAYVFRSEIAAELSGTAMGETVTPDTIATLVTHPSGITYGAPGQARIIPFINKTDLDDGLSRARILASRILEEQHPRIDRIVLGQAQFQTPVMEVIKG